MPSLADMVFVCAFFKLTFSVPLLNDPDIGWHIRNGEHILSTHAVPRADYFSYTMAGRPWYAWEWLYDVLIAGIHAVARLNGVVLFSALAVALTFTLLFRLAFKASGNLPVAFGLTFLAGAASSIHLMARPHVLTWLSTLIWFRLLDSHSRGERRSVFLLPILMVLWVNMHGGFLVGLALLVLFAGADLWTVISTASSELRAAAQERARRLALVLLLSLGATLITPYGYRLYAHLFGYLSNRFLMDNISEFLSPDFHLLQVKAFALLLIIAFVAIAINPRRTTGRDLLLVAFAAWIGLYAARSLPIASILLTLTLAPMLGEGLKALKEQKELAAWLRRGMEKVEGFSSRTVAMEELFNRHVLAAVAAGLITVIACSAKADSLKTMHFDDQHLPVQAAGYMAAHNIRDHFYSPDSWSGYLIYRLYPQIHVMLDDRHDFYGEAFLRDCLKVWHVGYGWQQMLDTYDVQWVVIPADSSLSNTLKIASGWTVIHDDHTAIIFERTASLKK